MNKEKALSILVELKEELSNTTNLEIKNCINIIYKYICNLDLSIKSMLCLSPQYDFRIVEKQIRICHRQVDCAFDLDEVIEIFHYYAETYKRTRNESHPNMKNQTIKWILKNLHTCTQTDGCDRDIEHSLTPNDYPPLIDKFFCLNIDGNYSIALFMGGDFRGNIFYKLGGGL